MDKQKTQNIKMNLIKFLINKNFRIFCVSDIQSIIHELNINEAYLNILLHQLAKEGWLERIKKGTYILSSSNTGITPIHEYEIAMCLVEPAMISHYSAFSYHNLTEQILRDIYLSTLKTKRINYQDLGKFRKSIFNFQGVTYHFIKHNKDNYFGGEKVWVNDAQIQVTDLERTLLDGLALPKYCGGFSEVVEAVHASRDKININKIIDYAQRFNISVARRIGWALHKAGIDYSEIKGLVNKEHRAYSKLIADLPEKGERNKMWYLIENF